MDMRPIREWWTHWHTKGVLVAAISINVGNALYANSDVSWSTMSWVMAGVCLGFLLSDTMLWRMWMMNRALLKTVEEQNEFIQKLGAAKADEVADRIAQAISEITGHETEVIKVPNDTFRKGKLH
jgi:hypothetical protein